MQFTLVHTLLPVNIEDALGDDSHLVHLVSVESNHTKPHQIGDVIDVLIFRPLQFQFASQ